MELEVIVGAAIVRNGTMLAQQRAFPEKHRGYWELPGGRVELAESEADAVRRECFEELGATVVVDARVGKDAFLAPGKVLRIFAAELAPESAEPKVLEHLALKWLTPDQLPTMDWLPADRELLPDLIALLS